LIWVNAIACHAINGHIVLLKLLKEKEVQFLDADASCLPAMNESASRNKCKTTDGNKSVTIADPLALAGTARRGDPMGARQTGL